MQENLNVIRLWDLPQNPILDKTVFTISFMQQGISSRNLIDLSLTELVERDSDRIKSKYLGWIYELGTLRVKSTDVINALSLRCGRSLWWMTSLVEKSNCFDAPYIEWVLKLIALDEWMQGKCIKKIYLYSNSKIKSNAIKSWCLSKNIEFIIITHKLDDQEDRFRLSNTLAEVFHALASLLHRVFIFRHLIGVGFSKWRLSKNSITFVSYSDGLDEELARKSVFKSNYWGEVSNLIKERYGGINWLLLYSECEPILSRAAASKYIATLNKNDVNNAYSFLESFISLRVIFSSILDWMYILRSSREVNGVLSKKSLYGFDVWPLFSDDFFRSIYGSRGLNSILDYRLFSMAFLSLEDQQKIFYLQEDVSWEKCLIGAIRDHGGGVICGVVHNLVRYWDLRFYHDPRYYKVSTMENLQSLPKPDYCLVNNETSFKNLDLQRMAGYRVEIVEAIRYNDISDVSYRLNNSRPIKFSGILVIGEININHTLDLLNTLSNAVTGMQKNFDIYFKPHPNTPMHIFSKLPLQLIEVRGSLNDALSKSSIVVSALGTTASVVAWSFGKSVVIQQSEELLNQSPLRGVDSVYFVRNSYELKSVLVDLINPEKYASNPTNNFFVCDVTLSKWVRFLDVLDSPLKAVE